MGRSSSRRNRESDSGGRSRSHHYGSRSSEQSRSKQRQRSQSPAKVEQTYGYEDLSREEAAYIQRLSTRYGTADVQQWASEGIPLEAMGSPRSMDRFRERKGTPVPWNVEAQNEESIQRSEKAASKTGPAGETGVPESVRDVLSSSGQTLDASIQRVMEERMGDNLGDVRIHTGPRAAKACEDINARAFTVGNHVAFNAGEYDPESPEGQHVLAHELAHVRQQTGGAVSMLPQEGLNLEIDPDPALEREAEETAKRVMEGGELGIQRLADTEVHVQRVPKDQMFGALAVFELENEGGDVGEFQQDQNAVRSTKMREWISEYNEDTNEVARQLNEVAAQELIKTEVEDHGGTVTDGRIEGPKEITDEYLDHEEAKRVLQKDLPSRAELEDEKRSIEDELADKMEQVAMTESQREKLSAGVDTGLVGKIGEKTAFGILKKIDPIFKVVSAGYEVVKNNWGMVDGDIVERAMELREELLDEYLTEIGPRADDSQGVGSARR